MAVFGRKSGDGGLGWRKVGYRHGAEDGMNAFVNKSATRFFRLFLFLTLGLPILAVLLLWGIHFLGLYDPDLFAMSLVLGAAYFAPVHFLFGSGILPVHEFGPDPGVSGFAASVLFYVAVSYVLGNAIGAFVGKKSVGCSGQGQ